MPIKDLKPNSTATFEVRICSKGKEKVTTTKRGYPLRICNYEVGDATGIAILTMFNEGIDDLNNYIGNIIKITDGWVKEWHGIKQISLGKKGSWQVQFNSNLPSLNTILDKFDKRKIAASGIVKVEDLKANSVVNIKLRVCAKESERTVKGNLRMSNFKVADETGVIDLTLFDKAIEDLSSKIGSVIKITNGWVKEWQGDLQLSLGRSGILEFIDDSELPSLEDIYNGGEEQNNSTEIDSSENSTYIKVANIGPDTKVNSVVRVCDRSRIKYLKYKSGKRLRIRYFYVGDECGMIIYTAFNEEINELGEMMGKVIELKNCWAQFFKNKIQISSGNKGTWTEIEDPGLPTKETIQKKYDQTQLEKISELTSGMVYYSEIVGIRFQYQGKAIYSEAAMTELDLKPEPTNPHDNHAVSVWLNNKKVGYIPKKQNRAIFKALTEKMPEIRCMLGVYTPQVRSGYNLPYKVRNVPITISALVDKVEWRPVMIYPEDLMAL